MGLNIFLAEFPTLGVFEWSVLLTEFGYPLLGCLHRNVEALRGFNIVLAVEHFRQIAEEVRFLQIIQTFDRTLHVSL